MTTAATDAPFVAAARPDAPAPKVLDAIPVIPISRPSRRHLWVLLAITLLGGVLRFSFPDRPLLWGDDAYTVYRTHAEYGAMLDILQRDGFTPLHYELYWLLGRAAGTENSPMSPGGPDVVHSTGLTPSALRLLPAFFGTAMVPAMYFLAAQLVRRRTALVVALVTACSAYLLGYSRDMKMYMMVWCFSALSAGCLLWWFRTGTRIAWLAWVAASLAMASSHMTGMALLPFELIFFFTRSRVRWNEAVLFLLGLAVIALPPAGYMAKFNVWVQESVEDFGFEVEGLGWVVEYNTGRTGPDLIRYSTSAYLFSWEWPRDVKQDKVAPWVLTTLKAAAVGILLLAAVGAMPWGRRLRGLREAAPVDPQFPVAGRRSEGTVDSEGSPQPWWRLVLWLGLWIVVPTYFLYCRSMPGFASPGDWWREAEAYLATNAWRQSDGTIRGSFWGWLSLWAAVVAGLSFAFPKFRRALVALVPLAAGLLLLVLALRAGVPQKPEPKGMADWVPVVAKPLLQWFDWLCEPAVLTGLLIVLPGLWVYYCGPTWRRRAKRVAQFAAVAAVLVLSCRGVYSLVQSKFEKEVKQAAERAEKEPSFAAQVDRLPGATRGERAYEYVAARVWQSIFMPRYTGFVWIAVCIALCALLMRLPTRPLRWAAVVFVVGVNLAQFGNRLFAGTEPPLDRVARDLWAHDSHNAGRDPTALVFINDAPIEGRMGRGHPGYGTLDSQAGKYYLGLARGRWIHPREWTRTDAVFRDFDVPSRRGRAGAGLDYSSILAQARKPQVGRIIVWEKYFGGAPAADERDPLDGLLKGGWRRAEVADYPVRFHWTWEDLYLYRRSEYVRTNDAPAPQGSGAPAR